MFYGHKIQLQRRSRLWGIDVHLYTNFRFKYVDIKSHDFHATLMLFFTNFNKITNIFLRTRPPSPSDKIPTYLRYKNTVCLQNEYLCFNK